MQKIGQIGSCLPVVNTILAIIGILVGIIVPIFIYYYKIDKKLDELVDRQKRKVSLIQAEKLVDLYLEAIENRLNAELTRFIYFELKEAIKTSDTVAIHKFISKTAIDAVKDTRNYLSPFRLENGRLIKDLLYEISPTDEKGSNINKAQEAVKKEFRDVLNKYKNPDSISLSDYRKIVNYSFYPIETACDTTEKRLKKAFSTIYLHE